MPPSLLELDKNAKPGFLGFFVLAGLTLLAIAGIAWIVQVFGTEWHPAAEVIFFFVPGLIFARLSLGDFQTQQKAHLAVAVLAGISMGVLSHYLLLYGQPFFQAPGAYEAALRSYLHFGWWPGFCLDLMRAALVPAVCEEVFFRGLIFSKLEKMDSAPFTFFSSALLFALAHGVPIYGPLYFLLGLGAAAIYRAYGLTAAILAHLAFNAVGLVFWQLG